MQEVLIYLSNEYADWEIGYIGLLVNRSNKYAIKVVSDEKSNIISLCGLNVVPDYSIDEVLSCDMDTYKMLILCGGDFWKKTGFTNNNVKKLVDLFKENHLTISAICDATTYLAYNHYLNDVEHTGNSVEYIISTCPNYKGQDKYVNKQCVGNDEFITANGTATLEFTREIMKNLQLKPKEEIEGWYQFHKNGFYSE